jgi:YgiT-type zinc finger domain-containing protein
MKCSIEGCSGQYEERRLVHALRYEGRLVVISQLPAKVCSVCGDAFLESETVTHIEMLLGASARPESMVPVYEYRETQERT